jgi:flavin reductase (DIM6/NTAB) family NADH-FMN oxidoreductase RutF
MLDAEVKKTVLRMFTYGLYALTVPDLPNGHAATVNWVTQSSFEPPLLAVSVEKVSRTISLLRQSGVFAVNVYGSDHGGLAGQLGRRFANKPDKFQGVPWSTDITGSPLLDDALAYVECRVNGEVESGDSVIFVGEIVGVGVLKPGDPLTMRDAGFKHAG